MREFLDLMWSLLRGEAPSEVWPGALEMRCLNDAEVDVDLDDGGIEDRRIDCREH